jgi:hypothetical protein
MNETRRSGNYASSMRRARFLLLAVVAGAAWGCSVDSDSGGSTGSGSTATGGGGTATSSASGSASSASSGAGGGCATAADCEDYGTTCVTTTCTDGACGWIFAPHGQPLPVQVVGDCQIVACDGDIGLVSIPDDTDPEDDGNPCTQDACAGGVPIHPPYPAGSSCPGGSCDGAGHCAGPCATAADCAPSTACAEIGCVGGACVATLAPAGTDPGVQTAGDCQRLACDGSGGVASLVDDTDVPAAAGVCMQGACSGGVPSQVYAVISTPCGGGFVCDGAGQCVECVADADCGPATACAACTGGHCVTGCVCPAPPAGLATTLPDCDAGLDPTKSGGELMWAEAVWLGDTHCTGPTLASGFALGRTGDIAVGGYCNDASTQYLYVARFNAVGAPGEMLKPPPAAIGTGGWVMQAAFDLSNRLYAYTEILHPSVKDTSFFISPGPSYAAAVPVSAPQLFSFWSGDALGNYFFVAQPPAPLTVGNLVFPQARTYVVSGGTNGDVIEPEAWMIDVVADGTGGTFRSANSAMRRVDASHAVVYTRSVNMYPQILALGDGSAIVGGSTAVMSSGFLCSTNPPAPGGRTYVSRLDPTGACVYGMWVPVPNLVVALAPGGGFVLSGTVNVAGDVDLGGGPLPQLGNGDFVIGAYDAAGQHVWSRRFGGPGIGFKLPSVVVSAAGNVYLKTAYSGTVALGGAPITAGSLDTVVASFSPTGAHRWSRRLPLSWPPGVGYTAAVDGCGATVVVSSSTAFDLGCGQIVAPWAPPQPNVVIARYAP